MRRGAGAYAELFHLGADFLDRYNAVRVPARTLVGAGLGFPVAPSARFTFEGKNLQDVRTRDVAGFPLPGRTWSVALEARFPQTHPLPGDPR
jgi:hypothetical protein